MKTSILVLILTVISWTSICQDRPNILLITADDLGFADIGCYGSEIPTPHLDSLAMKGTRFTRFYASPTCSPTRAMLMSGVDNHLSGLGTMERTWAANQLGKFGYEGYLNDSVATVARVLNDNGYHTYLSGKWHLGKPEFYRPVNRGFEETFALLSGSATHYNDTEYGELGRNAALYSENGTLIESLPEDFYSSRYFTQKAIEQIKSNRSDSLPFFSWLSYTAPHSPIQAPEATIQHFKGKYDGGYEEVRKNRFKNQQALGLFPSDLELPPLPKQVPPWQSLSEQQKVRSIKTMEVYAAMIYEMDKEIGRMITYLKESGLYKNTLIIFMSDNGADVLTPENGLSIAYEHLETNFNNAVDHIGKKGSFACLDEGWSSASSTPLKLWKGTGAEGGIRVPMIIHHPKKPVESRICHQVSSVLDFLPTALDFAGANLPVETYKSRAIMPPQGNSVAPIIHDRNAELSSEGRFINEVWRNRVVIDGKWKLVSVYEGNKIQNWELFDLEEDPFEANDLTKANESKRNEMIALWETYQKNNNVILADVGVPMLMMSRGVGPRNLYAFLVSSKGANKVNVASGVIVLTLVLIVFFIVKRFQRSRI